MFSACELPENEMGVKKRGSFPMIDSARGHR